LIGKIKDEVRRERAAVVSKKEPSVLRFTGQGGFNSINPGEYKPKIATVILQNATMIGGIFMKNW